MRGAELKTLIKRHGYSETAFALSIGVNQSTVNRWVNSPSLDRFVKLAIHGWAASNFKPAPRRKSNPNLPAALASKSCPGCGGALWFSHSQGQKRRGIEGRVFVAVCKTHQENPGACRVTSVCFNERGEPLLDLPRFAPRPFKKFSFERPKCGHCGLPMLTNSKPATGVFQTSKGEIREVPVSVFFCKGGRWGKPKHKLVTSHKNEKGGDIQVQRGKRHRLSELPTALRLNFPKCCGRLMRRARVYPSIRTGKEVWYFHCGECHKEKGFYRSGEPHVPYLFGKKAPKPCPDCGKRLQKSHAVKDQPELIRLVCDNPAVKHQNRTWYFHRKNGREYVCAGSGSQWRYEPKSSIRA